MNTSLSTIYFDSGRTLEIVQSDDNYTLQLKRRLGTIEAQTSSSNPELAWLALQLKIVYRAVKQNNPRHKRDLLNITDEIKGCKSALDQLVV